jgi:hypothetical protein
MTGPSVSADLATPAPLDTGRWPGWMVARVTARKATRSATIWGAVFGLYVASSALGYAATYKTPLERASW